MKIREGFISNSSTTSFTCDACGEVISYHDSIGYEDIGVIEFECGHGLCCNHPDLDDEETQEKWRVGVIEALKKETEHLDTLEGSRWESKEDIQKRSNAMKEIIEKEYDDFSEFRSAVRNLGYGWRNFLPDTMCPVCTLDELNYDRIMEYVVAKHKLNLSEVHEEIKERFGTFEKFSEWLKEQAEK